MHYLIVLSTFHITINNISALRNVKNPEFGESCLPGIITFPILFWELGKQEEDTCCLTPEMDVQGFLCANFL